MVEMNSSTPRTLTATFTRAVTEHDYASVAEASANAPFWQLMPALERLNAHQRAVVYRLLPKQQALDVFEAFAPAMQADLVASLQDGDVAAVFAQLSPDDRVSLLDELPASVAQRLLKGLPDPERHRTGVVLGYTQHSVGRRMSPDVVSTRADLTVGDALSSIRPRAPEAETIYTIPVVDNERRVQGVVSLRDLFGAGDGKPISELVREAPTALVSEDAEHAARRCVDLGVLALPVVDSESRLVGILTIEDAVRILEREDTEDAARQGGAEPLHRPYLSSSIMSIVRSRVVWLLVLAIGATLTVQVLSVFEDTLEEMTVLALFVPLLIGTGGNTGNQAATTVTRALALSDVRPQDAFRVLLREMRIGLMLGGLLGLIGFTFTSLVFDARVGLVIGLTLVAICTVAASLGGVMPLVARSIRADPAVFSNPFITTFVDAIGLIIYFLIARAVFGL